MLALIAVSFFALLAHHHEAGHDTHDCVLCQALQQMFFVFSGFAAIFYFGLIQKQKFSVSEKTTLLSLFHGATLSNRAPPIFA